MIKMSFEAGRNVRTMKMRTTTPDTCLAFDAFLPSLCLPFDAHSGLPCLAFDALLPPCLAFDALLPGPMDYPFAL